MSQQAAHGGLGHVREKKDRNIVRLTHDHVPHGLRVTGMLEVKDHLIPFRYTVSHDTPVEHHENYLNALHEKGVAWVSKRAELADVLHATMEVGQTLVEVVECNLALFGPFDWRLILAWRENGKLHEQTLHYRHPGEAPGPEKVIAIIRKEAESHKPVSDTLRAHEEVLRALRTT